MKPRFGYDQHENAHQKRHPEPPPPHQCGQRGAVVREERQQRNGTEDEKEEDVGYGWGEHRGSMEDVLKKDDVWIRQTE